MEAGEVDELPNPGIEPGSPALQADALPSEPPGKPFRGEKDHLRRKQQGGGRGVHVWERM